MVKSFNYYEERCPVCNEHLRSREVEPLTDQENAEGELSACGHCWFDRYGIMKDWFDRYGIMKDID